MIDAGDEISRVIWSAVQIDDSYIMHPESFFVKRETWKADSGSHTELEGIKSAGGFSTGLLNTFSTPSASRGLAFLRLSNPLRPVWLPYSSIAPSCISLRWAGTSSRKERRKPSSSIPAARSCKRRQAVCKTSAARASS